jgi:hypothetical protein
MVLNRAEVIGHGNSKLREVALSIVEAAIGQGDPAAGTRAKVRLDGNVLWVDGQEYDLGAVGVFGSSVQARPRSALPRRWRRF